MWLNGQWPQNPRQDLWTFTLEIHVVCGNLNCDKTKKKNYGQIGIHAR